MASTAAVRWSTPVLVSHFDGGDAMTERIWALVPAAGSGQRMGAGVPKQYLPLAGQPMLWHTLKRLCQYPHLVGVQLVLAPDDTHWAALAASLGALAAEVLPPVAGGRAS